MAGTLRSLATRVQRRVERTLFPLGKSVRCPYCGWTGWRFLSAGARMKLNRLCPRCGSLERYRMLPLVIERERAGRPLRVLELAPKACFTQYCRGHADWQYVSSDLASPTAMVRGDLRSMPFATSTFDVVVVFHVMEHIIEDQLAFAEIARLLKPDGLAIICVPLSTTTTQEGAPPADWERLYGQDDHVRFYGMDVEDRMRTAGLRVRRVDTLQYFSPADLARYGLRGDDRYLFLVEKSA
ncbi:MAG TPA: class I SAM-dependent methyltransferase [Kofleriaceae bacterium]